MTKFCGKDFLVNQEDTPASDTWTVVGGMRSTGMTINNETVDVTDKGDAPWRQLANCGIRSMSLSLSGIFSDDAILQACLAAALAGTILNYQLISGMGDDFEGPFQIASMERTGEYNGAEEYSISFESAAEIVYTAAP